MIRNRLEHSLEAMSAQDGTCSEGSAQQGYPSLCKNGCGFFSSVDSKGFCSVCYKDFLKKEQGASGEASEEVTTAATSLSNLNVNVDEHKEEVSKIDTELEASGGASAKVTLEEKPEAVVEKVEEEVKDTKKKKSRCLSCKKKLGLTGFTCRCGGLFCGLHRYSDKHTCSFDYKALGEVEIREANPVIVAEKVTRI